jgi:hypothetical protein
MSDMEPIKRLRVELSVGSVLIWIWGVWTLFHWRRPATRMTDAFVFLAFIGAILILHSEYKRRRFKSS